MDVQTNVNNIPSNVYENLLKFYIYLKQNYIIVEFDLKKIKMGTATFCKKLWSKAYNLDIKTKNYRNICFRWGTFHFQSWALGIFFTLL